MKEYLFVEKYRPATVKDCILPQNLKSMFQQIVDTKEIPNMILSGGPGCGKTTVAKAICKELGVDYIFVNASENGNIETLRTTVRNFASTVSFGDEKIKVVILDEGDYLNPQSFQPSLRGLMEEFAGNCRFIITCNYKNRIIAPLHSRCSVIDFKIPGKEKPKMASELLTRIKFILENEKIEYDEKIVAELVIKFFPDFRKILGDLQTYSKSGKIDVGILTIKDASFKELIKFMKEKNFTEVRKWVAENSSEDPNLLFRKLYDSMDEHIEKASKPEFILILSEYQYKLAFVADQEICLAACMVEIMQNTQFK